MANANFPLVDSEASTLKRYGHGRGRIQFLEAFGNLQKLILFL